MQFTIVIIAILAIGSGVFYYQKTETQIDQLQHELITMQNDQIDYTSHIARLTGLLRRHHIKYGEIDAKRK